MRIGYACLTVGVPETEIKSCKQRNATEERLKELISFNLNSLEKIINYNIKNNINLFRISSDIIPFGSSPVNRLCWWKLFGEKLYNLGQLINKCGMRVSMHPGQYTVLNSPDDIVVKRAICDLEYHARFLDSLETSSEHKIILHIGGVYQDKDKSMERFITNYTGISNAIKKRLVIENDDRSYNIKEVLTIGKRLNIPVVFDNLHNQVNPAGVELQEQYWIMECRTTWSRKDGPQKIHYSQQNPMKKAGSHSDSIELDEFTEFYSKLESKDLDIMLEVKDKNLSAMRCIHQIHSSNGKTYLLY